MSRKVFVFAAIFCFALSVSIRADDTQDIRALIIKENVSCKKGDANAIMSCYAPGFVGYWQMSDDPEDILIWVNGIDDLRKNYAEIMTKSENIEPTCEVRHVSIKGDKAVAISRHWKIENEIPQGTHHSLWTLAKIKGQWKITSFISRVKGDRPFGE